MKIELCCLLVMFFGVNSFAEDLRSPSGQSYPVVSKGPVQAQKNGEKTFAVTYQAKSLGALKADAGDLMSTILTEVERGGYNTVVVTATGVGRPVLTKYQRQPSGMWLEAGVKDTVSERWKAALTLKYAAADQAFKTLNFPNIEQLMTPDFFHRLANGKQRTRSEELALARGSFKRVDSWQTKIKGFYYWRDHLYVVSEQEWSGIVKPGGKEAHLQDVAISLDQWNPKSFLLEGSFDVSEESKPL